MKKVILVSLIVISSVDLYAQKEKNKIEATIVAFFNGLSLINSDTLKYYSTSDFQLLEDGEVWNLDTLISKIMPLKNSNLQRTNQFEFIKIEQNKNNAWVSYNNSAEFRLGEKQQIIKWLESAVLIKNKGRWKIQMLHSTKLK
jgi:hypothetical protein